MSAVRLMSTVTTWIPVSSYAFGASAPMYQSVRRQVYSRFTSRELSARLAATRYGMGISESS